MYEPPIEIIYKDMQTNVENNVFAAVQEYGIAVDKEELIKALQYDRDQYERGYRDGLLYRADEWISVEERLPEEGKNVLCFENGKFYIAFFEKYEEGAWWDWVAYDRDDTWNEVCPSHWMPLPEPPGMKGGE